MQTCKKPNRISHRSHNISSQKKFSRLLQLGHILLLSCPFCSCDPYPWLFFFMPKNIIIVIVISFFLRKIGIPLFIIIFRRITSQKLSSRKKADSTRNSTHLFTVIVKNTWESLKYSSGKISGWEKNRASSGKKLQNEFVLFTCKIHKTEPRVLLNYLNPKNCREDSKNWLLSPQSTFVPCNSVHACVSSLIMYLATIKNN